MANTKNHICTYLEDNTKALLNHYAERHSISRSATIGTIENEFFLTRKW